MSSKSAAMIAAIALTAPLASASTLYRNAFETADPAHWVYTSNLAGDTASASDGGGAADYSFDYSALGIPAAPNQSSGQTPNQSSTRGLKLQVSLPGTTVISGTNVSPLGLALPATYRVSFYAWQNTNGPFPAGGDGASLVTKLAIGASGVNDEWNGGTLSAMNVGVTNDGGSSYADFRPYTTRYPNGYGTPLLPSTGVFAAGKTAKANDNLNTYYASFAGGTPPAAQTALYPQQTGKTAVGTLAFGWHQWTVTKDATTVTWSIDGKLIATIGAQYLPSTFGPNIGLGMVDSVAPASTDPNAAALQFSLITGLTVDSLTDLLPGDANYDNTVDFTDLLTVAKSYGVSSGQGWNHGDFDGDGAVTFSDLLLLAKNYGASTPANAALPEAFAEDWALAQALVPEPAVLLAGMAMSLTVTRRCRQQT